MGGRKRADGGRSYLYFKSGNYYVQLYIGTYSYTHVVAGRLQGVTRPSTPTAALASFGCSARWQRTQSAADLMPCRVCRGNGHNRTTCPMLTMAASSNDVPVASKVIRRPPPRGYREVLKDGQIVIMKLEELFPEKVECECGVRVSATDRRALIRHQSTKSHLKWASKQ